MEIASALTAWGLSCTVAAVDAAPQIITYHLTLNNPMQLSTVKKYLSALSATLHTPVKAVQSDRAHIALQVNRPKRSKLPFKTALTLASVNSPYEIILGVDGANKAFKYDFTKAPHTLIAGATGSGKSICLNVILNSLLFRANPNYLRLLMIDTKQTELTAYGNLPHLYAPIATNKITALQLITSLVNLMRERYKRFAEQGINDITQTNLPRVLLVIDELGDLILQYKDAVEPPLITLAQLGRSAGIHLIIATQRPTVDVVTGLLKANLPYRIALQTASIRDSITILDHKGAESLTGKGDALIKTPDRVEETRIQIPYISREEVNLVTEWWNK